MSKREKLRAIKKKTGKIRNKLLIFIMPTVFVLVAILVIITSTLSSRSLKKKSTEQLEASMSTQVDNISSWMNQWSPATFSWMRMEMSGKSSNAK